MFIVALQNAIINRLFLIAIVIFTSFLFVDNCLAGHFALAFQRKQPAWENGDTGQCGGAACRVWVWDETGKPLQGIKLQTSWDILLGETDSDGRAEFNATEVHHDYDVLCTDNNSSTNDLTRLMTKNLTNCPGRHSYEVGFLYKTDATNPGEFDLDLNGDWPEPLTTFNQAPYTKSLSYSGVDYRDQFSDDSLWGNWQGSGSYFGQTFVATGHRVVAVRSHGTIGGLDLLDWKLRIVTFPELKQVGPATSVPFRWPFAWQAFWGVDDVPVVPGQKYMLQIWREGDGMNAYRVLKDVYPDGEYYEGTTAFPGMDLNGHICCMKIPEFPVTTGLVGYWNFDEGQAEDVNDISVKEHHGSLINMDPNTCWIEGRNGTGLEFDGVDDFVEIANYQGITQSQGRSCAAWINTTEPKGDIVGWGKIGSAGKRWNFLLDSQGRLRVEVGGGAVVGTATVIDGQWHHVAVASDGSNTENVKLYVDGRPDTISSASSRDIFSLGDPNMTIGGYPSASRYFKGTIDEVAVFDTMLSDKHVVQLYTAGISPFFEPCGDAKLEGAFLVAGDVNNDCVVDFVDMSIVADNWLGEGVFACDVYFDEKIDYTDISLMGDNWLSSVTPGLVMHLGFDEITGARAYDESVFGYDGTCTNMIGTDRVEGKKGGSLFFDGINDYIAIDSFEGIEGWQGRSVCAWIKTMDTSGVIVGWGQGVAGGRWVFVTESRGFLRLEVGGGAIVGSTSVCDGKWHHVSAVFDNDGSPNINDVILYVDGVVDSPTSASDRVIDTKSGAVSVGVWPAVNRPFEGLIDDVRIYNRLLTEDEIVVLNNLD